MILLCHLEAEIYMITVLMATIIDDLMDLNPFDIFDKMSDISPRKTLAFFFLTNIYNEDLKSTKKPFEVIF